MFSIYFIQLFYLLSGNLQLVEERQENDGNYSYFLVKLHLKRRALFYTFYFMLPCFLIGFLSIFGFLLPPNSCEKVNLCKKIMKIRFSLCIHFGCL